MDEIIWFFEDVFSAIKDISVWFWKKTPIFLKNIKPTKKVSWALAETWFGTFLVLPLLFGIWLSAILSGDWIITATYPFVIALWVLIVRVSYGRHRANSSQNRLRTNRGTGIAPFTGGRANFTGADSDEGTGSRVGDTDDDFELSLGEVYGARQWIPDLSNGTLRSIYMSGESSIWEPGVNIAKCGISETCRRGVIPNEDCSCGFYAYYDLKTIGRSQESSMVTGIIRGTGRTLVGSKGFRSEKAEIVALLAPSNKMNGTTRAVTELILSRYNVPVLSSRRELEKFAKLGIDQLDQWA